MSRPEYRPLAEYLSRQRWYTGTGDDLVIDDVLRLGWLQEPGEGLGVRVELATVTDGPARATYNVPVAYRREPARDLDHAWIGLVQLPEGELHAYDALQDPEAVGVLLRGFVDGEGGGGLEYHRMIDPELGAEVTAVPLLVEQSNSSVILDDTAMLKFFRRVSPGRNPDIEVLGALAEEYADTVPRLFGWLSTVETPGLGSCDLAILQAFLRTATEGWQSARTSVRDLLAEPGLAPEHAGGDFAGEAERLGAATRLVHDGMARLLPTDAWGPDELAALATHLTARFDEALAWVPTLAEHRAEVLAAYQPLLALDAPVPVQRIHGDLHLGQTLRTSKGWKLIDFEGEPARPLAERTRLDVPMRDVAGMLRSFDYVAQSVLAEISTREDAAAAAESWTARNREAFLRGYGAPLSPHDEALLRAYELDKAVYETVYETLHRPTWVHIPWRAVTGRPLP